MSKITADDVRKVAKLARLDLPEAKIATYTGQLERILDYACAQRIDLVMINSNGLRFASDPGLVEAVARHRKRLEVYLQFDSFDDDAQQALRGAPLAAKKLAAVEALGRAGVRVILVCTLQPGVNDHEIVPMARHFRGTGHILRFIEFMDVGASNGWRMDEVVPSAEIVRRIDAELPLASLQPNYPGEVAERWAYRDGSGEIGVISSVTQPFCSDCSRARLSTEGSLYTCLFATGGHDLRALLRGGDSDERIAAAIGHLWGQRDDRYSEIRSAETAPLRKIEMSYIGG